MSLLRRRRTAPGGATYAFVKDRAGEVVGLWMADAGMASDGGMIEALLAKHSLWRQVGMERRLEPNTVDARGGMFVMFSRPEPIHGSAPPVDATTRLELEFDGRLYPVHETFEPFAQAAAAGGVAMLRTTFDDLSNDDESRLFGRVAAAFGDDAPQTRAMARTILVCLSCSCGYDASQILFLRHARAQGTTITGINSRTEDISACLKCAGTDVAWVYNPEEAPPV